MVFFSFQEHSHSFYRVILQAFEPGPNDSALLLLFYKYRSYFALIETAVKLGAGV